MSDPLTKSATLADLHERLEIAPTDLLSYGMDDGSGFVGGISTASDLQTRQWPMKADCWAGYGVMKPGITSGRGTAADVVRIPAVWADLDVQQGKFESLAAASEVISELSNMLNAKPAGIILSGGGIQPIWALDEPDVVTAAALLARFGSLVRLVADRLGNGTVDSVFEPARILRMPNTNNVKQTIPRPTSLVLMPNWAPLEGSALADVLDTYGAVAANDPYEREVVSEPDTWEFNKATCGYAITMVNGWKSDEPPNGRHNWLGSQIIRLFSAKRMGCISEDDFIRAETILLERFTEMCEQGIGGLKRKLTYGEIPQWVTWGKVRAATKSDEAIWATELGGSPHGHWIPLTQSVTTGGLVESPEQFLGSNGLLAKSLSDHVIEHIGPFALGPEGKLWRYMDGVYRRGGDAAIAHAVSIVLGERFRQSHETTVTRYITNTVQVKLSGAPVGTEYINCKNGLLNWRTGELEPHTPSLPTVTQLPVEWNPGATAPSVSDFISRSMGGREMIDFFSEVAGAVIYGGKPFHQRAIMLEGGGQNGKSVAIALLMALVGEINCSSVAPQDLGVNRFATARLYGMLANLVGDVDSDTFIRTGRFKAVTSGDLIDGEEKYSNAFTFSPVATIVCSFNELPQTADRSDGFYRRWLVVPFPNKFVESPSGPNEYTRDSLMLNRLTQPNELSGFLNLAVAGLRRLYDRGDFHVPQQVQAAHQKFMVSSDPFRQWFEAEVQRTPVTLARKIEAAYAYGFYKNWCLNNGFKPLASNKFGGAMKALKVESSRTGKARYYNDIEMIAHAQGATIHPLNP